jgi:hypothetical protein
MAIVYQHRRMDTNEVFYIGIGNKIKRAYSKDNRNNHWHNVVNKVGYSVEITHKDIIWEEACSIEKYLISFYGRRDLGLGNLVNMTDGGDGSSNISKESREKISEKMSGSNHPKYGIPIPESQRQSIIDSNKTRVISEETREKHRKNNQGKKHGPRSVEVRRRISEGQIGNKRGESTGVKIRERLKGRIAINNGYETKKIYPYDLPDWEIKGYTKGSLKYKQ